MSSTRQTKLPAALGYRMPAEWETHVSTWLAWPHFRGDWPGKFEPIAWVYAEIIRNLAKHERVDLIVNSERVEKDARAVLEKADALCDHVVFHRWRTDRVWTRDSGCIFLTDPRLAPKERARSPSTSSGQASGAPSRRFPPLHNIAKRPFSVTGPSFFAPE